MLDGKLLTTLFGVLIAFMAVLKLKSSDTNEGFLGMLPSMQYKLDREVGTHKGDLYSIPGTYQSILSPRFSNVDYGANIRYNLPSYQHQATPCDPLSMGQMASKNYNMQKNNMPKNGMQTKENYGCGHCGGGCGAAGCSAGGISQSFKSSTPATPGGWADGNYNEVLNASYGGSEFPSVQDSLVPVGDMTMINSVGETVQPIVYDRYIYANRNSRLRSQGDPIRGDLPIVPCSSGWFRPSVHPSIDLQEGAMNVMGGIRNETSNALADLINTASGGGDSTIGGVNMVNQFSGSLGAAQRDVSITAFP